MQQKESTVTTTQIPQQQITNEAKLPLESLFLRNSLSSSSASASRELIDSNGVIRDARLKFLRTILQKIKQHAEDMGFDGTMQVSVIEVEPQGDEVSQLQQQRNNNGKSQQQILSNFFPNFQTEDHLNVKVKKIFYH